MTSWIRFRQPQGHIGFGVLDNGTSEPSHTGSWKAWLCGYGSTHSDTVMQQVSIAPNATAAAPQ